MQLPDEPGLLRSYHLRYAISLHLVDQGPSTVAEITGGLLDRGYAIAGRPGKTVSDNLRAEVRRGRAVRLDHGLYGPGRIPRATLHRMRHHLRTIRDHLQESIHRTDDLDTIQALIARAARME